MSRLRLAFEETERGSFSSRLSSLFCSCYSIFVYFCPLHPRTQSREQESPPQVDIARFRRLLLALLLRPCGISFQVHIAILVFGIVVKESHGTYLPVECANHGRTRRSRNGHAVLHGGLSLATGVHRNRCDPPQPHLRPRLPEVPRGTIHVSP